MLPPSSKMSGPPPGPTPQGLTSLVGAGRPQPAGPEGPNPGAEGAPGGLKDVFDELQQTLDALASVLPEQADEIDEIRSELAEILAKAISGGAPVRGRTQEAAGSTRPEPGLPV